MGRNDNSYTVIFYIYIMLKIFARHFYTSFSLKVIKSKTMIPRIFLALVSHYKETF